MQYYPVFANNLYFTLRRISIIPPLVLYPFNRWNCYRRSFDGLVEKEILFLLMAKNLANWSLCFHVNIRQKMKMILAILAIIFLLPNSLYFILAVTFKVGLPVKKPWLSLQWFIKWHLVIMPFINQILHLKTLWVESCISVFRRQVTFIF